MEKNVMGNTPIITGDTRSILQYGPAPMKNQAAWTQMDSDIIAHFLQVQSQIAKSRWRRAKVSFSTQGAKLIEAEFPDFEDFVFAAVYFRQLIAEKDALLDDAVDRYLSFLDCGARHAWIDDERRSFNQKLEGKCFIMLPDHRVRELFDAFMYG